MLLLQGREDHLARTGKALSLARQRGSGRVISIGGPAGIGKSALLSAVADQARALGFAVAGSKCDEIDRFSPGAPIVAALRPGAAPMLPPAVFEQVTAVLGEPLLFAERVTTGLEDIAAHRSVLLVIDDLQWADRVTRLVLRTLCHRTVGLPVIVLLASRGDARSVTEGLPGADVEELTLAPLTPAQAVAMAVARLGRRPDPQTLRVLRAAEGNPFLITQVVDTGPGGDREPGPSPAVARLAAAIGQQLAQVTPDARAVIELVAVAGRPLAIAGAAELLPQLSNAAREAAVRQALDSGLLVIVEHRLTFRHDLIRESVYEGIDTDRRRELHRRFATSLLEAHAPLAAAPHAQAGSAGGDVAGAAILAAAAERLVPVSAEDAGELAVSGSRIVAPGQAEWVPLSLRFLAVLVRTQRTTEALTLADLLLARTDDPAVAGRIEAETAHALWLNGQPTLIVQRVDRVLGRGAALDPAVEARLRSSRALARTRLTTGDVAAREASAALEQARAVDDPEAVAVALRASGEAAKNEGRHWQALTHFRELRAAGGAAHLAEEIMALQLLDRYDHAQVLLDQARREGSHESETLLPSLLYAQLWQDFGVGRLAEADAGAQTLSELGRELGNNMYALEALMIRSTVRLYRGDTATAAALLKSVADLTDADDDIRMPGLTLSRGMQANLLGRPQLALEILRPLLWTARESRTHWPWWPGFLNAFYGLGEAGQDREFAAEAVALAELGAERNPGVLSFEGLALALRGRLEGDLVRLAEAVTLLAGSPRLILRAYVAEALGEALMAAGEHEAGLVELDRAWDAYHAVGAWAFASSTRQVMEQAGDHREKWSVVPAEQGRSSLTDAERRVAELIAAGQTNRGAASALGISANTVGTHLRSVFGKLGVQSRVQLANVLLGPGR